MKKKLLPFCLAVPLLVAGCSDDSSTQGNFQVSTTTESTTSAPEASETPEAEIKPTPAETTEAPVPAPAETSIEEEPVVGFTGAPGAEDPHVLDK